MAELVTQVGVGGILALLILREVLGFLARRRLDVDTGGRRPTSERFKTIQGGIDAILVRLDRIIEKLEYVADATRSARKQTEITGEMTERMCRTVAMLEETLNDIGRRRTADTQPGA